MMFAEKKLLSDTYFGSMLLAFICLATLLPSCRCLDVPSTSAALPTANSTQAYKECTSIDIRNVCESFLILTDCTVIIGYVMIALVPNQSKPTCDYDKYRFPKLREITGFMIFYEARGLTSIANMFPNLTVIRGRRLFLNYALGVTNMHDLQSLEFKSLVAIQRGHVYIGSCPKLCQLERVNWDRLTLSTGENHILVSSKNCTQSAKCNGCESNYCWSNMACQVFENDRVTHYHNNVMCHEQCLGGCHNVTNRDCVVCRSLTDYGVCVDKCPSDKFLMEQYQRCYTHKDCTEKHSHFTYGNTCVAFCPSGFQANPSTRNCEPCNKDDACISTCTPDYYNEAITIYNLADTDDLRGCQIVNSSLIITIRNQINEEELARSLSSIREIRGHLKVFKSSYLTSLKFLSNISRIHGDPLENDHYGIVLYDNKNLRDLWVPQDLELMRGGMYMHRNNKLCNQNMRAFQERVVHDKTFDSLQTSDQEVLCGPSKLNLALQARTQHTLKLSWLKQQTSEQVEIIYRLVPSGAKQIEQSELDAPICMRINWQRRLLFLDELQHNGTHYSYTIDELQPNSRYACLVRTFGSDYQHDARSDLLYVTTKFDIPGPPYLRIANKTDTSLSLVFGPQNGNSSRGTEQVDYFLLNVRPLPDNQTYIDQRNYCRQPAYMLQDMETFAYRTSIIDYDDCCAAQAEEADDRHFVETMRNTYSCTIDQGKYCEQPTVEEAQHLGNVRLERNASRYTIIDLKRYSMYAVDLRACNKLGCSSPAALYDRTNYTIGADLLTDLSACRVPHSQLYVIRFSEPKGPNSLIVAYVIHYRMFLPKTELYQSHVNCLTRLQHSESNFTYVANLNDTYDECAVRVHSLAGDVMTDWVNIDTCTQVPPWIAKYANSGNETSPQAEQPHGINIFVVFFLFGCSGTIIWVIYKRRCWRKIPELRRYLPVVTQIQPRAWLRTQTPVQATEDREILVDSFETVRFQNSNPSVGE